MVNEYNQKPNRVIFLLILVVIVAILVMFLLSNSKEPSHEATVEDQEKIITTQHISGVFSDGLTKQTNIKRSEPDQFGVGITEIATYKYDINQDGRPDKIIRMRKENGTAHFQYVYKVFLNDGTTLVDITPKDFFTIEGVECALQKIQFSFEPDFSVTKISRPLGDNWNTPTRSTKTVYSLWSDKMHTVSEITYKTVCDVSDLF